MSDLPDSDSLSWTRPWHSALGFDRRGPPCPAQSEGTDDDQREAVDAW